MKLKEKSLSGLLIFLTVLLVGLIAYPSFEFSNSSFSINGSVLDESKPLSGVSLKLLATDPEGGEDTLLLETVSDADGNFSLGGLPFDASYKLVPSFEGKFFSPNQYAFHAPAADAVTIPELNGPYIFETSLKEISDEPSYYGYIVQFDEPSIIDKKFPKESEGSGGAKSADSFDEDAQLHAIKSERDSVLGAFQGSSRPRSANGSTSLRILGSTEHVMNSVLLDITDQEAEALKIQPGVKAVFKNYYSPPIELPKPDINLGGVAATPVDFLKMTNAHLVHQLGFSGKGVTVAVIDGAFNIGTKSINPTGCSKLEIQNGVCSKIKGALNLVGNFDINKDGDFDDCYEELPPPENGRFCEFPDSVNYSSNPYSDLNLNGVNGECYSKIQGSFTSVEDVVNDPRHPETIVIALCEFQAPGRDFDADGFQNGCFIYIPSENENGFCENQLFWPFGQSLPDSYDFNEDGDFNDCYQESVTGNLCELSRNLGPHIESSHGTNVAAIVAGSTADYKGIAPDSHLFFFPIFLESLKDKEWGKNMKLFPLLSEGPFYDIISEIFMIKLRIHSLNILEKRRKPTSFGTQLTFEAISQGRAGAIDIVNISLGGKKGQNYYGEPSSLAAESLARSGVFVVAAAGNGNDNDCFGTKGDSEHCISSPAVSPEVIAVGADDTLGNAALWSSRGPACGNAECTLDADINPKPNINAPGESIPMAYISEDPEDRSTADGTSFASPMVAGAVAIILEAARSIGKPDISSKEVKDLFLLGGRTNGLYDSGIGGPVTLDVFGSLPRKINLKFEGIDVPPEGKIESSNSNRDDTDLPCPDWAEKGCESIYANAERISFNVHTPKLHTLVWEGDCVPDSDNKNLCFVEPGTEEEVDDGTFSLTKNIVAKFKHCEDLNEDERNSALLKGDCERFFLEVTTHGDGNGTVTGDGINCSTGNIGTCQKEFFDSSRFKLTAKASAGSQFTGWAGICRGNTSGIDGEVCNTPLFSKSNFEGNPAVANFTKIYSQPDISASLLRISSGGSERGKKLTGDEISLTGFLSVGLPGVPATTASFEISNRVDLEVMFHSTVSVPALTNHELEVRNTDTWTPEKPGYYSAKFCVDSTSIVTERSESNNCLEENFTIVATKTLTITKNPSGSRSEIKALGDDSRPNPPNGSRSCSASCNNLSIDYPVGTPVTITVTPAGGEVVKRWNVSCLNNAEHNSNFPETMLSCELEMRKDESFSIDFLNCGEDAKDEYGILPENCPKADIRVRSVTVNKSGLELSPNESPKGKVGEEISLSAVVDNIFGKADTKASIPVTLDLYAPPKETQDLSFETKTINGLNMGDEETLDWAEFTPEETGWYLGIVEVDPGVSGSFLVDENPSDWENNIKFLPILIEPRPFYELNVTKTNDGAGVVRLNNAVAKKGYRLPNSVINCGEECSAPFEEDDSVTLEAIPETGTIFKGWSGENCSGTSGCTVKMTKDKETREVNAEFELKSYPFTVTVDGDSSGTLSVIATQPNGAMQTEDCTTGCTFPSLKHGTELRFIGTPAANSTLEFSSPCSNSGQCNFTLEENTNVKATFDLKRYDFSLEKEVDGGSGSFSGTYREPGRSERSICSGGCTTSLAHGTVISVEGNPSSRSTFEWSGACSGSSNCKKTLTGDSNATGTFLNKYKKRTILKTCNQFFDGSDCGDGIITATYDGGSPIVCPIGCGGVTFEVLRSGSGKIQRSSDYNSYLKSVSCSPSSACNCKADQAQCHISSSNDATIYYDFRKSSTKSARLVPTEEEDTELAVAVGSGSELEETPLPTTPLEYIIPKYSTSLTAKTPRIVTLQTGATTGTATSRAVAPVTPDLVSYNLIYYPLRFTAGSKVSFYGYVFNEGHASAAASTTTLRVLKHNGTGWDEVKKIDFSLPNLGRFTGEAVKGVDAWEVPTFGRYKFELCADSKNVVTDETNKSNNCRVLEPGVPTVSVTKSGSGNGRVKSKTSPEQTEINCGAACSDSFQYFTQMQLTANANSNSRFVQWSGEETKLSGVPYAGCGEYLESPSNKALDGDQKTNFRCEDSTKTLLAGYDLGEPTVINKARVFVGKQLSLSRLKDKLQDQVGCQFAQFLKDLGEGTVDKWDDTCPWSEVFKVSDSTYTSLADRLYRGEDIDNEKIGEYNTSASNDNANIYINGSLVGGLRYYLSDRDNNAPPRRGITFEIFLGKPSDYPNTTIEVSNDGVTWKQVAVVGDVNAEDVWFNLPINDLELYRYIRYNGGQTNHDLPEVEFYGRESNICTGSDEVCNLRVENLDQEIGAVFERREDSRLTIAKLGSGVVKTEAGTELDCGTKCVGSFGIGETVTVVATPDSGMSFKGFSGVDANGCDLSADKTKCTLVLDEDKELEAKFEKDIIVYGDVDGNGKVLAADALMALNMAVGILPKPVGDQFIRADAVIDNKINATDALFILQAAVGLIELPIEPSELGSANSLELNVEGGGSLSFASVDKNLELVLNTCQDKCEGGLLLQSPAEVVVTAEPKAGYIFAGCEGAESSATGCKIKINGKENVKILFESETGLDLKILDVKPTRFRKGKPAKFKTRVTNLGSEAKVAPVMELKVDENNDGSWDKTFREVGKDVTFKSDPSGKKKTTLKIRNKANFWTPTKDGNYRYQFCVNVPGDKNPSDNCTQNQFTMQDGRSRSFKRLKMPTVTPISDAPLSPVTTTSTTTTSTTFTTTTLSPTTTTVPVHATTTTLAPTTTTTTLP